MCSLWIWPKVPWFHAAGKEHLQVHCQVLNKKINNFKDFTVSQSLTMPEPSPTEIVVIKTFSYLNKQCNVHVYMYMYIARFQFNSSIRCNTCRSYLHSHYWNWISLLCQRLMQGITVK